MHMLLLCQLHPVTLQFLTVAMLLWCTVWSLVPKQCCCLFQLSHSDICCLLFGLYGTKPARDLRFCKASHQAYISHVQFPLQTFKAATAFRHTSTGVHSLCCFMLIMCCTLARCSSATLLGCKPLLCHGLQDTQRNLCG